VVTRAVTAQLVGSSRTTTLSVVQATQTASAVATIPCGPPQMRGDVVTASVAGSTRSTVPFA